MKDRNPDCYHLSASSINAFKSCPTRFRLAYREGLRLNEDTEAQRMGTNWHALHEVYNQTVREWQGESPSHDAGYAAAVEHLNNQYEAVPSWIEPEDWEVERLVLLTAFHVYLWYYTNDPIESLHEELAFDLPLHEPQTGLPLPQSEVLRVGKIDTVIKWQSMIGNREMKSTSRSIGPDSDYWERSAKDTQVSMYALAMRDLLESGGLSQTVTEAIGDGQFGNTLYDVWRKPKSRPKNLTQKDTAAFCDPTMESFGKYFDQEFEVTTGPSDPDKPDPNDPHVTVDGVEAVVKPGKKGYAIRETPRMFAARLMHDMVENPSEYFVRKEIARTDNDLRRFRIELYRIYQAMRSYERSGAWFENENQCRATFRCAYIPICYGPGADHICETGETPPEYRRIFNVTVDGEAINDHED